MTVEELLAKLDAEYKSIDSQLPSLYESYGRYKYHYPEDHMFRADKYDIEKKLARMDQIFQIKRRITSEAEKASE